MSLIYREKVSHMLNDLASVSARLSVPSFGVQASSASLEVAAKKPSAKHNMRDDPRFNIAEDFAPSFEIEPLAAVDAVLKIMEQDMLLDEMDPSSVPLAAAADERDRLFEKFMEKSFASVHMDPDEAYDVDFEFDQNGEIVQRNVAEGTTADVLQDIDLDQDFQAVAGTVEELLKTQNTGTNDPHFSTTGNNAIPLLLHEAPRKRRKIRFLKDGVLTFGLESKKITAKVVHNTGTLPEIVEFVSRTNPHFVNSCYMAIFGPVATSAVPLDRYPLAHRHPATSSMPLQFHAIMGIEVGRNYVPPNFNLEEIDNLPRNHDFATGQFPDFDYDFDLDLNFSPDISIEEIGQDNEDASAYAKMLGKFHAFVQSKLEELPERKLAFEELVPSRATATERPVHRKFAATAFTSILQLATMDQLQIECSTEGTDSGSANEIYVYKSDCLVAIN